MTGGPMPNDVKFMNCTRGGKLSLRVTMLVLHFRNGQLGLPCPTVSTVSSRLQKILGGVTSRTKLPAVTYKKVFLLCLHYSSLIPP